MDRRRDRSSENSDALRSPPRSGPYVSVPRGPRLDAPSVLHHATVRGIEAAARLAGWGRSSHPGRSARGARGGEGMDGSGVCPAPHSLPSARPDQPPAPRGRQAVPPDRPRRGLPSPSHAPRASLPEPLHVHRGRSGALPGCGKRPICRAGLRAARNIRAAALNPVAGAGPACRQFLHPPGGLLHAGPTPCRRCPSGNRVPTFRHARGPFPGPRGRGTMHPVAVSAFPGRTHQGRPAETPRRCPSSRRRRSETSRPGTRPSRSKPFAATSRLGTGRHHPEGLRTAGVSWRVDRIRGFGRLPPVFARWISGLGLPTQPCMRRRHACGAWPPASRVLKGRRR